MLLFPERESRSSRVSVKLQVHHLSDVYNYGVKIDVYNYVYINFGRMAGEGSRVPHNLQLYMYLDLEAESRVLKKYSYHP